MGYLKYVSIIIVLFGLLGGCAPKTSRPTVDSALVAIETEKQREIALETQLTDQKRLINVAFPIRQASTDFCGEKIAPSLGIVYVNKYAFPEDFETAAVSLYGLGEPLEVGQVVTGSPAERAGLQVGDVLVSIDGQDIPTGKKAVARLTEILKERLQTGNRVDLSVVRNEAVRTVGLVPVDVCDYPVLLGSGDSVNAFADGKKVVITRGMLRFVNNDQELAMVIAHELAHNAMGHVDSQKGNYILGSIIDVLAGAYGINTQGVFGQVGARVYSKGFEAEADYVSLYMMSRANMEITEAPKFWRRMAAIHPGNIGKNHAASHPATPERFVALEKTVAEINEKISRQAPLVPEYKE